MRAARNGIDRSSSASGALAASRRTAGTRLGALFADSDFGDTNEVVYYQASTLFSVHALSDGNGSVIERYRYDAYGGATVLDADGSVDADGLSDVRNPYLFTGRRLDPESGLMQYRHRYYSPIQVPPCQDRKCGTRHYPPAGQ